MHHKHVRFLCCTTYICCTSTCHMNAADHAASTHVAFEACHRPCSLAQCSDFQCHISDKSMQLLHLINLCGFSLPPVQLHQPPSEAWQLHQHPSEAWQLHQPPSEAWQLHQPPSDAWQLFYETGVSA